MGRDLEEKRILYKVLVGKRGRENSLGRHGLRWKDNVRIDLRVIGWEDVDWT
jgi:hypothetical protein